MVTSSSSDVSPDKIRGKRKLNESNGEIQQPPAQGKRYRYISLACNECRKRKIRCDGQMPCQRCDSFSFECIYAPNFYADALRNSVEFRQVKTHISALQDKIEEIQESYRSRQCESSFCVADAATGHGANPMPSWLQALSLFRPYAGGALPRFYGLTGTDICVNMAKSTIRTEGLSNYSVEENLSLADRSQTALPRPIHYHHQNEPLWLIEHSQVSKLCQLFEEEIGIMYPVTQTSKLIRHARRLYDLRNDPEMCDTICSWSLNDEDTRMLKIILAIALVLEGGASSELGQCLFDSAKVSVDLRLVTDAELPIVKLLILTAIYHFQKDELVPAWRFIGMAARHCLEIGLHRRQSALRAFTDQNEHEEAVRMFWIVYALDRSCSFSTGLPFALQDADIDPKLQQSVDSVPFLKHITPYNSILTRIWDYNMAQEYGQKAQRDMIGFLDYQLTQWYQDLPNTLQCNAEHGTAQESDSPSTDIHRLRLTLYLQKNQGRIFLFRRVLHDAISIAENLQYAQRVVHIAKDTINTLMRCRHISDINGAPQRMYNQFFTEALLVLFLSLVHGTDVFGKQIRQELTNAITFATNLSPKSNSSERLRRIVRELQELGTKVGLLPDGDGEIGGNQVNAHCTATVPASTELNINGFLGQDFEQQELLRGPGDWSDMTGELSNPSQGTGSADGIAGDTFGMWDYVTVP